MRTAASFFALAAVSLLVLGCGENQSADGVAPEPEIIHKGRPLAEWANDLESEVPRTRNLAVAELQDLGSKSAGAIPALVKALGHEKTYWSACNALEAFGTAGYEYAAGQCRTGDAAAIVVAKYLFENARTPEAKAIAEKALDELDSGD